MTADVRRHWSENRSRGPGGRGEPSPFLDHAKTFGVPILRMLPGDRERAEAEARALGAGGFVRDRDYRDNSERARHWSRDIPSGELRSRGAR
jgi:hypothetical protein